MSELSPSTLPHRGTGHSPVVRRRHGKVIATITGLTALAWMVMFHMAAVHLHMGGALGPGNSILNDVLGVWFGGGTATPQEMAAMPVNDGPWTLHQFIAMFIMWQVMMVAMMLPTAVPVVSTFADIQVAARDRQVSPVPTWVFVGGYMATWGLAAAGIVVLQATLTAHLGSIEVLAERAPDAAGLMLIAAGLYNWTPVKDVCLRRCQSPISFLLAHWRDGRKGAFRMGLHHGAYCVGCCWAYMSLMFVAGTMNLVWMLALTTVMVVEKIVPGGNLFGRLVGTLFIAGGLWLVIGHPL